MIPKDDTRMNSIIRDSRNMKTFPNLKAHSMKQ